MAEEQMIEKMDEHMRSQVELINCVPSGMGIYTFQDGVINRVFLNDGYFNMLGIKKSGHDQYYGDRAIYAVHPEDRGIVRDGIKEAMESKEGIAYRTIRMILGSPDEVLWVQMNGRVVSYEDGKYTIYVSFINVDELMKTSNALEKNQKVLESSLAAGKQLCCEYDPILHTLDGKTGQSHFFHLPNHIENFPESLLGTGLFHPEDEEFIRTNLQLLEESEQYVEFEIRIRFEGQMRWFRFCLQKMFDEEKGYDIAICNFMDITVQQEALTAYKNHLDTVMKLNPDAISTFRMNLTKNQCTMGTSHYRNILKLLNARTVEGFFEEAEKMIHDKKSLQEFHHTFQREYMLEQFAKGNSHISLNHLYELEDQHVEWIRTSMDLMENPETNDVEGILYSENINREKIEGFILSETMRKDYIQIVIQFEHQRNDEYYLFDNVSEQYYTLHEGMWEKSYEKAVKYIVSDGTKDYYQKFSKEHIHEQLSHKDTYTVTFERKDTPGRRYQMQCSYASREERILMITYRDITDEAMIEQLRYNSEHDALTGLYNRDKIYKECDKLLAEHPHEDFAIVQMDIQKFRLYNSYYGEKEGDKLLCYIADMLRELSKKYSYGVYGRSHSDVFLLCVPMIDTILTINQEYINEYLKKYRKDFYVMASCGIYISTYPHKNSRVSFEKAVLANKNNPNKAFNRVCLYNELIEHELQREQRIANEMKESLKNEEFVVYIQPKYNVENEKSNGGEALVRWIHPVRGLVSPGTFIPIFEKNGFIVDLDRYVWEKVCQLIRRWLDEGKDMGPISVNISRVSMYSDFTVPFLVGLVKKYEIPVDLLYLELTESAFMEEPENMKRRLLQLHNAGFQIMMDDFGSAYSSLNMLRGTEFDYLKIDRQFLASVDKDERGQIVISSIVQMAKNLHMRVVVEGVETEKQKDFVAKIGCDYIQGFYYAKPMPAEEYEKTI